jgi:hypothetical protein
MKYLCAISFEGEELEGTFLSDKMLSIANICSWHRKQSCENEELVVACSKLGRGSESKAPFEQSIVGC